MFFEIKYGDGERASHRLKYRSERLARIHFNKLYDYYQNACEKGVCPRFVCLLKTIYTPEDFKKEEATCTQKSKK